MRVRITRGAPSRRKTVVAASASVGPTIAPRVKAAAQLRSGIIACTTTATMTIVKITRPIERRKSGAKLARRSRLGESAAALNRSGGRETHKSREGAGWVFGGAG